MYTSPAHTHMHTQEVVENAYIKASLLVQLPTYREMLMKQYNISLHNTLYQVFLNCSPMVGMVVTISPNFSLYRMVVLPAASKPTVEQRDKAKVYIHFNPYQLL